MYGLKLLHRIFWKCILFVLNTLYVFVEISYLHLIETFFYWDCVHLLFCFQNLQSQIFPFDVIFSMMRHVLVYFLYPEHFGKLQLLDEPAIIFPVKLNYHFIGSLYSTPNLTSPLLKSRFHNWKDQKDLIFSEIEILASQELEKKLFRLGTLCCILCVFSLSAIYVQTKAKTQPFCHILKIVNKI